MPTPYALGLNTLKQETNDCQLPVRGHLPSWLKGQLVRIGPARFEVGAQACRHWFDGLGMVYRFDFEGGRVNFSNRFLRGTSYCQSVANNCLRRDGFATNRQRNWVETLLPPAMLKPGDNCNVNIIKNGETYLALTETPTPLAFDDRTLETLGHYRFRDTSRGQTSTAHPLFDRQRNCFYNCLVEFGRKSNYHFYSLATGSCSRRHVATIAVDQPAYIHSFAATQNYLVLSEFPLVANPLRFVFNRQPFIEKYRWRPQRGTRFHVVEKDTGKLITTGQNEASFAFHHINAFEQGKEIIVDAASYSDATIIDQLYLDRLRRRGDTDVARPVRHFIPLGGTGEVRREILADDRFDFPRFNDSDRAGQSYRYAYGAGRHTDGNFVDSLIKLDVESGSSLNWQEAGCFPGEPVFVKTPDAAKEDAGVVLSVVLDVNDRTSFLLVLGGEDFTEQARAPLPFRLPFGFHGDFYWS